MKCTEAITKFIPSDLTTSYQFESLGAHAREDFSERLDGEWMKHSLAHFNTEEGTTTISYRYDSEHIRVFLQTRFRTLFTTLLVVRAPKFTVTARCSIRVCCEESEHGFAKTLYWCIFFVWGILPTSPRTCQHDNQSILVTFAERTTETLSMRQSAKRSPPPRESIKEEALHRTVSHRTSIDETFTF